MQTRLDIVIEEVKNSRKGKNKAWIYDENGKIKDDVMVCEVLDVLEELKDYEINVTDEWIEDFANNEDVKGGNTYNWSANISNDLNIQYLESSDGVIILIMVHLYGDIRGGYSDYFVVKFDNMCEFYELESTTQIKDINEDLVADLRAFSNTYSVYDYKKDKDIGDFCCLEVADLLEEIKEEYGNV